MKKENAIAYIKEWIDYIDNAKSDYAFSNNTIRNALTEIYCKVYDIEEKPKEKWIPVSERLPEEPVCDDGYVEPSDYVLVFGDFGDYGVSRYWGNRVSKSERPNAYKDWMDLKWITEKPIAWMELPKPYKAESEVEE